MRLPGLAVALAVTVAACGGKSPPRPDDPGDPAGPFVDKTGFEPTAFTAEVRGEGRPIIFIPGLGCPGDVFADAAERLGEGYEAHLLTLAGFAGQPPIKPPLAAKVRKELVRYIRSNKLEAPVIVGHSMGGFIAYWLAASAPDVIGGLVVIDAGPALNGDTEDARRLRNIWAQAGDDELPIQIRSIYSMMVGSPKRIEPFLAAIAESDRQTIGDAIYEMVTTDITDQVDLIGVPTLVVLADGGLQDRFRRQASTVPDHEVVVLPRTRHFVMLDDPAGFHRVFARYLSTLGKTDAED
jgi:pimeloyl-ACP methyl ester carboxylesterase